MKKTLILIAAFLFIVALSMTTTSTDTVYTDLNKTILNFEDPPSYLSGWTTEGSSVDWTNKSGKECDGGSGRCAYSRGDTIDGWVSFSLNLSQYDECYARWRYNKSSLETGEYMSFVVNTTSGGNYTELWRARTNEAPDSIWSDAPNSSANIRLYNINYDGINWTNLTVIGLTDINKIAFLEHASAADDMMWFDNVNLTCLTHSVTTNSCTPPASGTWYIYATDNCAITCASIANHLGLGYEVHYDNIYGGNLVCTT